MGALPQKSEYAVKGGQYRNAVASGQFREWVSLMKLMTLRATRRYHVRVLTVSNYG